MKLEVDGGLGVAIVEGGTVDMVVGGVFWVIVRVVRRWVEDGGEEGAARMRSMRDWIVCQGG